MVKNYIKIAWRNLARNKSFSIINILGLAIGLTGALLIALWLQNMLTMDRFHEKGDRLYMLSNRDKSQGQLWAWTSTPKILGPSLKNDFPDIEHFSRYSDFNKFLTTYDNKKLMGECSFVDSAFFDMFTFPIVKGDKKHLLKDAQSAVLTEQFAKSLFGDTDPIGKMFKVDSVHMVTVQAVMQDLPTNTDMHFDYLLSWEYAKKIDYYDEYWSNNSIGTYILLKEGVSITEFNDKIKTYSRDHINNGNETVKSTNEIFAFPARDHYLYNNGEGGTYTSGRIELVRLFTWVGAFILLVACINYTNLSTAKTEKRAKEIGVRKVVGADRKSLILQFMTESVLVSFLALGVAIVLIVVALPSFNLLVEKKLSLSLLDTRTWLFVLFFTIGTGVLSGLYPALLLSSFKPIKTLKGKINIQKKKFNIRSILVVVQFSIAITLIIATVIISKQIQHTQERDRGYNNNGLLYTSIVGDLAKNYTSLRNELLASNTVVSVSKNMSPITQSYSNGWGFSWQGSTEEDKRTSFIRYSSDADAVKTLGFKLLQGRDIDIYKYATDSAAVLLTESAVKKMRLENPVNTIVHGDGQDWTVVGIIQDFIVDSPSDQTSPMIIMGPKSWFTNIHYRLNPNLNTAQSLKTVENIFKKFNPDYPFEYNFADKAFENKFKETKAIGTLSSLFAGLTIFIACLGLLALIAYTIETRMKEIAVRKVLGASIFQITSLLSSSFVRLISISLFIAAPLAWWTMQDWLSNYSYRIEIKWYYFLVAGGLAIFITLLTISFQTIRAARTNPVDSLRDE